MHGDWITAIAAIVGAVIGVVGTLLIEFFRAERRAIRFVIEPPEDLAAALRSHGSSFELKINNISTQTLIAANVTVQNTGNVTIANFSFDIEVPGKHALAQAQPVSENKKLAGAIKVEPSTNPVLGLQDQPFFNISLPFFNPGETFKITTFCDGEMTRCNVDCRLPGVKVKIMTEEDVQRKAAAIERVANSLAKTVGLGSAAAGAALAAALLSFLSH